MVNSSVGRWLRLYIVPVLTWSPVLVSDGLTKKIKVCLGLTRIDVTCGGWVREWGGGPRRQNRHKETLK